MIDGFWCHCGRSVAIKKSNGRVYPAGFPLCKRGIEGDFAGQTFSKTRQFLRREVCVAQTFRFESEYSSSDPQACTNRFLFIFRRADLQVCVAQTFRFESEYSSSDPQTFIVKKEIPGVHFKGVQRICG